MLLRIFNFITRRINSFAFRILVLLKGGYIPFNCTIDISNLHSISVGKAFRLGSLSRISVAHNAYLVLGSYVTSGHNLTLYCNSKITIHDHCRIAHNVSIVDSKYLNPLASPRLYDKSLSRPIVINENTLIYTGAIILLGVTIPKNSTIASYAIVHSGLELAQPGLIFGSRSTYHFKPYTTY